MDLCLPYAVVRALRKRCAADHQELNQREWLAGPFLDLRSPLGVTPAALKTPALATPAPTPESSPPEKPKKGGQPGQPPKPNREVAIKGGEHWLTHEPNGPAALSKPIQTSMRLVAL